MRRWLLILSLLTAFYLDNVFFNIVNVMGFRPDVMLAVVVSLGVLAGPLEAATAGLITGLITDIFFNKIVGLTALVYMLAGLAAGFFYRKFYADNLIIPTATAVVLSFFKEHFFLIVTKLAGGRPPYFQTLAYYIIPCILLTGGLCVLIHLFFKHALYRPLWRNEAINIER